jgi:hypothetical protein
VRREFGEHLIAVHGLSGIEGRNEDITLEALADFAVKRADEAEAVTVHGEGSDDEVAVDGRGGDGITVTSDEDKLAADDEIGEEGFELEAITAAQGELADKLLVSGGALGLAFDVLEQIAFGDHSSIVKMVTRWGRMCESGETGCTGSKVAQVKSKGKSKVKVNRPTSAKGRQKWVTRTKARAKAT